MEIRNLRIPSDIGKVLDTGTGNFEIIVAQTPAPERVMCYGVFNKATGIVEALTNSFAKARYLAQESHKDDTQGFDRHNSPFANRPGSLPPGLQLLIGGGGSSDDDLPGSGGGKTN
jgi:hypothetical protein